MRDDMAVISRHNVNTSRTDVQFQLTLANVGKARLAAVSVNRKQHKYGQTFL